MKNREDLIKAIGDLKVEVMKFKDELEDTLYHTNAMADAIFKGTDEIKVWQKWVEFRDQKRVRNRDQ